ncbi:class I SAM-dependent methyltransferase [Micromonospora coxensis]|uniref:Phospholipid N-methyltransferase n=1 Tax=Micromonospora coxensis TaxID=356852 RepID=A0A1C5I355_9ACTN|nr:rRNA adenine N-6-methyltransferase family protein [Micromonospora coxensis]SCG52557.1 Phospholipid N-methyltransferase [Micromonospora coxensis]
MIADTATFLGQFTRHPLSVGALVPSSATLARDITAAVPRTGCPVVVELGPGTGAFTRAIQERLDGRGHHLAVELNPTFAAALAARHPGVEVVTGDAADVDTLLATRGHRRADVVVSGLPWAVLGAARQQTIMGGVLRTLDADGVFTTFAYRHALVAPAARRFRGLLAGRFDEVTVGRTVWGNLPPALVYHCRRPLSPGR